MMRWCSAPGKREEIQDEGSLAIDEMEEWNVPMAAIAKLRGSLGRKLEKADTDVEAARGALRLRAVETAEGVRRLARG